MLFTYSSQNDLVLCTSLFKQEDIFAISVENFEFDRLTTLTCIMPKPTGTGRGKKRAPEPSRRSQGAISDFIRDRRSASGASHEDLEGGDRNLPEIVDVTSPQRRRPQGTPPPRRSRSPSPVAGPSRATRTSPRRPEPQGTPRGRSPSPVAGPSRATRTSPRRPRPEPQGTPRGPRGRSPSPVAGPSRATRTSPRRPEPQGTPRGRSPSPVAGPSRASQPPRQPSQPIPWDKFDFSFYKVPASCYEAIGALPKNWVEAEQRYSSVQFKCMYNGCFKIVNQSISSKSGLRSHLRVSRDSELADCRHNISVFQIHFPFLGILQSSLQFVI
jgi:hypothetical protein